MIGTSVYVIERIIGNNAVLVTSKPVGSEHILTGKGLGFGAKVGQMLQMSDQRIDKVFALVHSASPEMALD